MIINEWDTGRGAKQRCNVSFYLAFSFSRLKRLVRVRRWEGQSVSLSLSLPPPFPSFAFSRHTRAPSLSSSFVNDVTAFFLPRFQRVSTTMHVKSTRASIVTSRVFFSLSLFFTISPTLLNVHCRHPATPYRLPLLFSLEILLVFVPLFNEAPRLLVILLSAS